MLRCRLRTPCNSEHSVFIGQYFNKRTTYHSATELAMPVARRPTLCMKRLAPHSTLACPKHHASSSRREIHCTPRWQTATRRVPRSLFFFGRGRNDKTCGCQKGGSVTRSLGEDARVVQGEKEAHRRTQRRRMVAYCEDSEWSLVTSLMCPLCLP